MATYQLAFAGPGNETWDIVEQFEAANDEAANRWAEDNEERMLREYSNAEWYVLDAAGQNING